MIITDRQQLRIALRTMRRNRKLTQAALAAKLHLHHRTVAYRESGRSHLDIDAVLRTAEVFGYRLALVPQRHAGARPTGTGWPA